MFRCLLSPTFHARPRATVRLLAGTALLGCACVGALPRAGQGATLLTTLGFEDDVDLVAAPNREFLLIPEESESGGAARLTIVDLDPTTGAPLNAAAPTVVANLLGFENGVDPIVCESAGGMLAFVPLEKEDGSQAALLVLQLDPISGAVLDRVDIPLGNLGFRPDVDGVISDYPIEVAFFPLQSEDRTLRGLLAVDAGLTDGDWGACRLLSTDGRAGCAASDLADWLPQLAPGVDPVAYRTCCSVRVALPVRDGDHGDLLLLDFENDLLGGDLPPSWHGNHDSVRARNGGVRPTSFPGWEEDVDLALIPAASCGATSLSLLVPVEGDDDVADLYMLDADGHAVWTFTDDNGVAGRTIAGYERGVDLVRVCPGGTLLPRLIVPWENAAGDDAGLYVVDPASGAVLYDLEDPALNPNLTVTGYEVGVEPVVWNTRVVVPMESTSGDGALFCFNLASGMGESMLSLNTLPGGGWGFLRSVDPIVAAVQVSGATAYRLFVPVTRDAGGDASILFSHAPPVLEPITIEQLNGINFGGLEYDVDIGVVTKALPGQAFVALPEEDAAGATARLRFEDVPSPGPQVAVATGKAPIPASLFFFNAASGLLSKRVDNLLGLETGLDMAAGDGSLELANPPDTWQPASVSTDNDSDPTLMSGNTPTGVGALPGSGAGSSVVTWLSVASPFAAGERVRFALATAAVVRVELFDLRGRRIQTLADGFLSAGEHAVAWDGRDGHQRLVAAGSYFVRVVANGTSLVRPVVLPR